MVLTTTQKKRRFRQVFATLYISDAEKAALSHKELLKKQRRRLRLSFRTVRAKTNKAGCLQNFGDWFWKLESANVPAGSTSKKACIGFPSLRQNPHFFETF
jgi:hypothetical protein